MVEHDNEPLSIIDRDGFRHFIKTLQPLYKIPAKKTLIALMCKKYEVLQTKMRSVLSAKKNLVLTTDLWTGTMTTRSYLGLTAHYLDSIEMKWCQLERSLYRKRKLLKICR